MKAKELFDKYAERYDEWYDKHPEWFEKEVKLITKVAKITNPSLEVGVGSGRFAERLDIDVGIDISKEMLKIAKDRDVECVLAEATHLPFKDCVFNSVIFAFTICFLEKPFDAILEAKRVLSKKGELVMLIVPADSKLGEEYKRKDSPFYRIARFYTIDELKNMLKKAEMEVVNLEYENLRYENDLACITAIRL